MGNLFLLKFWRKGKLFALATFMLGIIFFFLGTEKKEEISQENLTAKLFDIPLYFEKNEGQIHESVKYITKCPGCRFYFFQQEIAMLSQGEHALNPLKIQFIGANTNSMIRGLDEQECKSHYFIGHDATQWITEVPNFSKVAYHELYPGIDAIFYGNGKCLEYDICVSPGANPNNVHLRLEGAQEIALDHQGNLDIRLGEGRVTQMKRPFVYQEVVGQKQEIAGDFVLLAHNEIGFILGDYDSSKQLVIDPVLTYSTYIGGDGFDSGLAVAVDNSGCAYLTGSTASSNFPITAGAFQTTKASAGTGNDVFISKLNSTGTALVYSTYLGGVNGDYGAGITVDSSGSAYVVGGTNSFDFPVTNGAFQTTYAGSSQGFITKLNPAGSQLTYSTYLGGSGTAVQAGGSVCSSVAIDSSGNAYVTGYTTGTTFPITAGAFQTAKGGGTNAFVAEFNASGTALVYSTYLGGGTYDNGTCLRLDSSGNAYVSGFTLSTNFPVTMGAYQTALNGATNAFIAKFGVGGSLSYATYFGGSGGIDEALGIAVDDLGNAYISGITNSSDLPVTPGAFQTIYGGGAFNVFAAKFNSAGNSLLYSTYIGGMGDNGSQGIAIDSNGNAYVIGYTSATNFPVTAGAYQTAIGGDYDAFITKLNSTGSQLLYSTYFGGARNDEGFGIALDDVGNAYVVGYTSSTNFPVTSGAFQTTKAGLDDVFAAKLFIGTPAITGISPDSGLITGGTLVTITGTNFDNVTSVTFGTTPATSFIIDSNTQIRAVAPPHASGVVDIRVAVDNDISSTSLADQYTYLVIPTSIALTVEPNPVKEGKTFIVRATVLPSSAEGSVIFFDGLTLLGVERLVNGEASITTEAFEPGKHPISAAYSGSDQYGGSVSSVVILKVKPPHKKEKHKHH